MVWVSAAFKSADTESLGSFSGYSNPTRVRIAQGNIKGTYEREQGPEIGNGTGGRGKLQAEV